MSSMYISTVFIFCVALNSFSAAEKNVHNTISRDEFEQMRNVIKMLQEKVQTQEARIVDLEKEIKALENGDKGSNKRLMTESRRQKLKGEEKQMQPHSSNHQKSEIIDLHDDGVKQKRPRMLISV